MLSTRRSQFVVFDGGVADAFAKVALAQMAPWMEAPFRPVTPRGGPSDVVFLDAPYLQQGRRGSYPASGPPAAGIVGPVFAAIAARRVAGYAGKAVR